MVTGKRPSRQEAEGSLTGYCTYCLWGQLHDDDLGEAVLCTECARDLAIYDEVVHRMYERSVRIRPLVLEAMWRVALRQVGKEPDLDESLPLGALLVRPLPFMRPSERGIALAFPEIDWLCALQARDRAFYCSPAARAQLARFYPRVPEMIWSRLLGGFYLISLGSEHAHG